MRHMLIVLGISLAAIVVGAGLYFYGPSELRETPVLNGTEASVLSADQAVAVSFAVLAEGTNASSVSERKNFAAYTEEDFARLWAMAYGTGGETMPSIDFDTQYVIGVFAGEKSSGGHSIKVASVTDASSIRTVSMALMRPGEGCVVSQALTNPFQLIAVPVSDRELARTETEFTVACQ